MSSAAERVTIIGAGMAGATLARCLATAISDRHRPSADDLFF